MTQEFKGDWTILTDTHPRRYPRNRVMKIAEKDGVYSLTWKDKNERGCRFEGLTVNGSMLTGRRIPGHRGAFVAFYDVDVQLVDPAHIAGSVTAAARLVSQEEGGGVEGDLVGTWGAEAKPRGETSENLIPAF